MRPERYQRVVEIFQEALDRSPDARQAFLAQACVGDDDLRREVESLLAQEGVGGGILSEPLGRIVAEVLDSSTSGPLKGADRGTAASESADKNQRPPWWLYVIACSFFAYFGVSVFSTFWGPESIGLIAAQDEGRVLVRSVRVNSPADHAAIKPGDQIVYGAGHPVENLWDWNAVVFNVEVERPIPIQIVRVGKRVEAVLLLNHLAWAYWWSSDGLRRLTVLFARFVYLALAFVIALSRPFNITALAGALFLASAAPVITEQVEGLDAVFRRLPVVLQILLWIAYFLTRFGMGAFFTFFAIFPQVLFRKPWIWVLGWLPILALIPWDLHYIYGAIYHSDQPTGSPSWTITAYPLYWLIYLPSGLTMLFLNYRRLTDPNERRRIQVIVT